MGVSQATLRRLERGDPGASAAAHLTALLIVGVADEATPALAPSLWAGKQGRRVKLGGRAREAQGDADHF